VRCDSTIESGANASNWNERKQTTRCSHDRTYGTQRLERYLAGCSANGDKCPDWHEFNGEHERRNTHWHRCCHVYDGEHY